MMQAVFFGIAMFIGWLFLDWTKDRELTKQGVYEALIAALIGAIGWMLFDLFLPAQ
ncbi:hypothetical protein [Salsuginibacillus halophilus]|uniref:hypothetical protein n=1 Tax=Salsuginibacillus halophilus TaxID=517424 RepID=UPI0015E75655|nr:hypothetical protein [Salsuginibacillus halophilus]